MKDRDQKEKLELRRKPATKQALKIREWRELLRCRLVKPIDQLEDDWRSLLAKDQYPTAVYGREGREIIDKLPDVPVLMHIRSYVNECRYPPPELLLSFLDCLNSYLDSDGAVSLEEAFFGCTDRHPFAKSKKFKTKKRVGEYAFRLRELQRVGMSREEAADKVAWEHGKGEFKGDTIIREINRDFPELNKLDPVKKNTKVKKSRTTHKG